MKIFTAAGGSGVRVLESLVHLGALGLGPERIRVLVIDPDQTNGNRRRTANLLASYNRCRAFVREQGHNSHPFFRTEFQVLDVGKRGEGEKEAGTLPAWSPVRGGSDLNHMLETSLIQDQAYRDVLNLFYTEEERSKNLDRGFQGHPSIGAAVMALLPQTLEEGRREAPWAGLKADLEDPGQHGGVDVVLAGSVFGGTGASTFYPVARFLNGFPTANAQRLRIHGLMLVPYFGFPAGDNFAAKTNRFPLATKAAALFYEQLRESVKSDPGGWPFASLSWLGDTGMLEAETFELGGDQQENKAYFVDLLAAICALEMFQTPQTGGQSWYAGPKERNRGGNLVRWEDIPVHSGEQRAALKRATVAFLRLGAFHHGFVMPALRAGTQKDLCRNLDWYRRNFDADRSLKERSAEMEALEEFFTKFHFSWWLQLHQTAKGRLTLLNQGAFTNGSGPAGIALDQLANLLFAENGDARLTNARYTHDFAKYLQAAAAEVPAREHAGAAYMTMLDKASARFAQQVRDV